MKTGFCILVLFACLFCSSQQVQAATTFTDAGADSVIANAANWDNGVPDNSGNSGTVPTDLTAVNNDIHGLDSKDITFQGSSTLLSIGSSVGSGVKTENSTLTFQGTSQSAQTGAIAIGRDQDGEDGANSPLGVTTINISDNATVISGGDVKVARGQNASIIQTGGVFSTGNGFRPAAGGSNADKDSLAFGNSNNGGVGTYSLSGGSVFALGEQGTTMQNGSLITISGGEVTTTTLGIGGGTIDFAAGSTGSLTVMQDSYDFATLVGTSNITLNGASAVIGDFAVSNSVSGQTTLSLPGVSLAEKLNLAVDSTTGLAAISNSHASPIAIDYYEVRGIKGALISDFSADFNFDGDVNGDDLATWEGSYAFGAAGDANLDGDSDGEDFLAWQSEAGSGGDWDSLDDRDFEGAGTWVEGADNSTYFVSESRTSGSTSITNGVDVNLDMLPAPGAGSNGSQLIFRYHVAGDPAGDLTVGTVSYTAPPLSAVTVVPEPGAIVLLSSCGLVLGATRSRRRSK